MSNWIVTFFVLAVAAAVLGFGGLAGTPASIAQFLAGVFVILFAIGLIYNTLNNHLHSHL